jgi:photosystem II stability/assembly factor-like uncharacterized protein
MLQDYSTTLIKEAIVITANKPDEWLEMRFTNRLGRRSWGLD